MPLRCNQVHAREYPARAVGQLCHQESVCLIVAERGPLTLRVDQVIEPVRIVVMIIEESAVLVFHPDAAPDWVIGVGHQVAGRIGHRLRAIQRIVRERGPSRRIVRQRAITDLVVCKGIRANGTSMESPIV